MGGDPGGVFGVVVVGDLWGVVLGGGMKGRETMNNHSYSFVFAILGECCAHPHLYGVTKQGATRQIALKKAIREVQKGGNDVFEVLEVREMIGPIKDVEEATA